jgi:pyruvate formate lyase activating enzyme
MIRSIIETSLVDWDGRLTTVLFFDKCNFICPFCQNWELLLHPEKFDILKWPDIEKMLIAKRSWIDGVVLTGGEPLVNRKEVFELTNKIKTLGFKVKIDTNGAFPKVLHELIDKALVDYVAMDIKAPLDDRYDIASGRKTDRTAIEESIDVLMKGRTDYEFRTTCVPGIITVQTVEDIGERIKGAKRWFLQQYISANAYKEAYRNMNDISKEETHDIIEVARKYVGSVKWRGKDPQ